MEMFLLPHSSNATQHLHMSTPPQALAGCQQALLKSDITPPSPFELSMGMSSDYGVAVSAWVYLCLRTCFRMSECLSRRCTLFVLTCF